MNDEKLRESVWRFCRTEEAADKLVQLIKDRDTKRDAYVIGEDREENSKYTLVQAAQVGYNNRGTDARQRASTWNSKEQS